MNLFWDNCNIDVTSFAGIYRFDMQLLTIFSSKLSELELFNGSNVWKQTFRGEMVKPHHIALTWYKWKCSACIFYICRGFVFLFETSNHVFSKPVILKLSIKVLAYWFWTSFSVCSKAVKIFDNDYVPLIIWTIHWAFLMFR